MALLYLSVAFWPRCVCTCVPTGHIGCFMGLSKGSARNAGRILQDCSGARSIEQQPETSHSLGIDRRYLIHPLNSPFLGWGELWLLLSILVRSASDIKRPCWHATGSLAVQSNCDINPVLEAWVEKVKIN